MRISDWSSDGCSSDLRAERRLTQGGAAPRPPLRGHLPPGHHRQGPQPRHCVVLDPRQRVARGQGRLRGLARSAELRREGPAEARPGGLAGGYPFLRMIASRSEEHTSELQSLMRISYAVFCLKKKTKPQECNKQQTLA